MDEFSVQCESLLSWQKQHLIEVSSFYSSAWGELFECKADQKFLFYGIHKKSGGLWGGVEGHKERGAFLAQSHKYLRDGQRW